jgi:DNA-binding transcriptional MerR regulator
MSRMRDKHDTKLYYSISEASAIAKVKPHVLRYWETQFKMLRPKKNKAGNRMYRRRDLRLIQLIKELLYDKGFTIAGARRKLLDERTLIRSQIEISFSDADRTRMLIEVIRDLKMVLRDLSGLARLDGDGAEANGSETRTNALHDPEEEAIAAGFSEDAAVDEPDIHNSEDADFGDGVLTDGGEGPRPGAERLAAEE